MEVVKYMLPKEVLDILELCSSTLTISFGKVVNVVHSFQCCFGKVVGFL